VTPIRYRPLLGPADEGVRLRIVVYHPEIALGERAMAAGPALLISGWARALTAAGADVRVAYDPRFGVPEALTPSAVRHFSAGRVNVPIRLSGEIAGADLLMLHSAWVSHNLVAAAEARRRRIPYTITPHGGYGTNILRRRRLLKRVWWLALEQRAVNGAAAIHVHFDEEKASVRNLGYRGPFIVAPNGFTPPEGIEWDGGSGRYVLWFGVFDVHRKGLDLLLRALAVIPEARRPRLRMHGHDWRGGRAQTQELVFSLRLQDWVRIGGPLVGAEKWDTLRRARAFVYPSRWESHSLAMMEVAGIGVPLVVLSTTVLGERFAAVDGAIVSDPSPEALADAISDAADGRGRRVAAAGRRLILDEFSWSAAAEAFLTQAKAIL
jgi:glycosyltransferase involved in cell wall biosynthesis